MKVIDVHPDDLLERELRGTLSVGERAHLDEHLAHCVACRMERALRSDFAAEDDLADEAMQARLSGALAAANDARPVAPVRRASRGALAAAAAVLLASGLATAQPALMVRVVELARESTRALLGEPRPEPRMPAPAHRRKPPPAVAATPATRATSTALERGAPASEPPPPPAPETRAPAVVPRPPVPRSEPLPAPRARRASVDVSADASADTSDPSTDGVAAAFERANGLRRERRAQEARAAYRELALLHPGSAEGRLALSLAARLALDEGDARGALVDFDAYLATGDRALREQALAGRALALLRLERPRDACTAFAALLAAYPSSTYASLARQRCAPEHAP